ncbi:unnamed protein product [Litomosoides sigmodontis]|uniref:Uncharacterized protein n=1 Tax=Litomosoides sigmodontis TaxID=42156 RepID=A0A3P6TAU1_LITSI|nr:unnamed protein product [Litomosoides sigmodontis]
MSEVVINIIQLTKEAYASSEVAFSPHRSSTDIPKLKFATPPPSAPPPPPPPAPPPPPPPPSSSSSSSIIIIIIIIIHHHRHPHHYTISYKNVAYCIRLNKQGKECTIHCHSFSCLTFVEGTLSPLVSARHLEPVQQYLVLLCYNTPFLHPIVEYVECEFVTLRVMN